VLLLLGIPCGCDAKLKKKTFISEHYFISDITFFNAKMKYILNKICLEKKQTKI